MPYCDSQYKWDSVVLSQLLKVTKADSNSSGKYNIQVWDRAAEDTLYILQDTEQRTEAAPK